MVLLNTIGSMPDLNILENEALYVQIDFSIYVDKYENTLFVTKPWARAMSCLPLEYAKLIYGCS